MLEIRNLTKVYKPKKGVPVTALDGISLSFPETGMVFLLGKSGCGKSTLLNLLGGLDSYDDGEIIISGESSKNFSQSQFDSYRNTLVGFIFQEYNVLEEFTVGANIALSLELQGKKASDEVIGRILQRVDLEGYGNRRPGELSGGQKQRVAIARALVKDPKIIMADEPTGALDSNTGRQVLDTLKDLSRDKLVIVVSHDREFAELYADRIVELSDGKVVSDREFVREECAFEAQGLTFGEGEIILSAGYHLTEEDREQINSYLAALSSGDQASLRMAKKGRQGRETVQPVHSHLSPIQFIRSRLPMKAAFRIGCGALKHKKIRLVLTVLLSCVAFGLFGLADTFGAYDHITTCTRSILDSEIRYASLVRTEKYFYGDEEDDFYYSQRGKINEEELDRIREESGVAVQGVFVPYSAELSFQTLYNTEAEFTKSDYHIYPYAFSGFAPITEETLQAQNMELIAGRLPDGNKNEIAISSYICETFYIGGFAVEENGKTVYETVRSPEDMLGRVFPLNGVDYTVVGVVSSDFDLERYRSLTEEVEEETTAEMLLSYALMQELSGIREYSLAQVALVGEGRIEKMVEDDPPFREAEKGYIDLTWEEKQGDEIGTMSLYCDTLGTIENTGKYEILWIDEEMETLPENRVVVSWEALLQNFAFAGDWSKAWDEDSQFHYSLLPEDEKASLIEQIRALPDMTIYTNLWYEQTEATKIDGVRIAGILMPDETGTLPDPGLVLLGNEDMIRKIVRTDDGIYQYAVGAMPQDYEAVEKLVRFSESEENVRFELQNPVTFELEAVHEVLTALSKVFLYVGIGFAVFAAILLANFIGTSVAYKKQEIGILRAIGARSNDVFRIFFSESFVIAMINFILSALGTFLAVTLINYVIRTETGILITILHFSLRQTVLLFGVSLLVAAAGSFLPVKKIASKKPIDAIRGR